MRHIKSFLKTDSHFGFVQSPCLQIFATQQKQYVCFNCVVIKELFHLYDTSPCNLGVFTKRGLFLIFVNNSSLNTLQKAQVRKFNYKSLHFDHFIDCYAYSQSQSLAAIDQRLILLDEKSRLIVFDLVSEEFHQVPSNDSFCTQSVQQFGDFVHVSSTDQICYRLLKEMTFEQLRWKSNGLFYCNGIIQTTQGYVLLQSKTKHRIIVDSSEQKFFCMLGLFGSMPHYSMCIENLCSYYQCLCSGHSFLREINIMKDYGQYFDGLLKLESDQNLGKQFFTDLYNVLTVNSSLCIETLLPFFKLQQNQFFKITIPIYQQLSTRISDIFDTDFFTATALVGVFTIYINQYITVLCYRDRILKIFQIFYQQKPINNSVRVGNSIFLQFVGDQIDLFAKCSVRILNLETYEFKHVYESWFYQNCNQYLPAIGSCGNLLLLINEQGQLDMFQYIISERRLQLLQPLNTSVNSIISFCGYNYLLTFHQPVRLLSSEDCFKLIKSSRRWIGSSEIGTIIYRDRNNFRYQSIVTQQDIIVSQLTRYSEIGITGIEDSLINSQLYLKYLLILKESNCIFSHEAEIMIRFAQFSTNSIFQNSIHLLENMLYEVSRSSSPQIRMIYEAIQQSFNIFSKPLFQKSLLFYNFDTILDNSADEIIQRLVEADFMVTHEDVFTYKLSESLDLYDLADLLTYETTLLIYGPINLSYPNNIQLHLRSFTQLGITQLIDIKFQLFILDTLMELNFIEIDGECTYSFVNLCLKRLLIKKCSITFDISNSQLQLLQLVSCDFNNIIIDGDTVIDVMNVSKMIGNPNQHILEMMEEVVCVD